MKTVQRCTRWPWLSVLAASLFLSPAAHAQDACDTIDRSWAPLESIVGPFGAALGWDPDGPGPLFKRLVVGGQFGLAGGARAIASWGAAGWEPLAGSFDRNSQGVWALLDWDPDGPTGPAANMLVAGGSIRGDSAGRPLSGIAILDRDVDRWASPGGGVSRSNGTGGGVLALTNWDPDGPGPRPPLLVAGGGFTIAGGVPATNIAAWDGTSWHALGDGLSRANSEQALVFALTTWDPDGPGPRPPLLVAGGEFTHSGDVVLNGVGMWDGERWWPLGEGLEDEPYSGVYSRFLVGPSTDPTSPADRLYAGGYFDGPAGGARYHSIALWDGEAWHDLGEGFPMDLTTGIPDITAMSRWDPDGAGPAPEAVYVTGGDFWADPDRYLTARLDGAAWSVVAASTPVSSGYDNGSEIVFDHDDDLRTPDQLVRGSWTTFSVGTMSELRDGAWITESAASFVDLTTASLGSSPTATSFDHDGRPDTPDQIVQVYTKSVAFFDARSSRTVIWESAAASSLAGGTLYDHDGDPATPKALFALGVKGTLDGVAYDGAAVYANQAWTRVPVGASATIGVGSVVGFDPDGPGPLRELVVASGTYTNVGDLQGYRGIIAWDGSRWFDPRAGATAANTRSGQLGVLRIDGQPPLLICAGGFDFTIGGERIQRAASWDGSRWRQLGNVDALPDAPQHLVCWDPDGAGPDQPRPVVACRTSPSTFGVYQLEADVWRPMGEPVLGESLTAFVVRDVNDDGPSRPTPVLLTTSGFPPTTPLYEWEGDAWRRLFPQTTRQSRSLWSYDPDGAGPARAQLFIQSDRAAQEATGYIGRLFSLGNDDPRFLVPYGAASVCNGGFASLSYTIDSDTPVQGRWQREVVPDTGAFADLTDGPTASGSVIRGSSTTRLLIDYVSPADAGRYRLIATNDCGGAWAPPLTLSIASCCAADYDGDGFIDFFDVDGYFACFEGGPCHSSTGADFNVDGFVDFFDFNDFVEAFERGC
jgi:hypothetical protein